LPIVGDIFRFLDNGRTGLYENSKTDAGKIMESHYNYKQYTTILNMTKESKGIKIMHSVGCGRIEQIWMMWKPMFASLERGDHFDY